MKKKPFGTTPGFPGPDAYLVPGQGKTNPQETGDAISAFVASGGATFFVSDGPSNFNAQNDGIQLLTSIHVPRGRTGWIKQVRVAPYCPAVLANPWQGWPASWQNFEPIGAATGIYRATAQVGVYTTPMGWESYFGLSTERLPQWRWWISCLPGSLGEARAAAGAGPFTFADPRSWYLAESIPVPRSVYVGGVPGRAPGGRFEPQRMQVLQGDQISWHMQIPEDTTACLWAQWEQSTVTVRTRNAEGDDIVMNDVPPLLPSFGQLVGYTQATSSAAALANARNGWGG